MMCIFFRLTNFNINLPIFKRNPTIMVVIKLNSLKLVRKSFARENFKKIKKETEIILFTLFPCFYWFFQSI